MTSLPIINGRPDLRAVILAGGKDAITPDGRPDAIAKLPTAHPGRFIVFTEPAWAKASDDGYSRTQADMIEDAHKAGAKGLKVLRTLGLFLRERGSQKLVRIDDSRFDPMWEAVGSLKMPVAIHVSDPEAFFLPIDHSMSVTRNFTLTRIGPSTERIIRAIANCRRRGEMA